MKPYPHIASPLVSSPQNPYSAYRFASLDMERFSKLKDQVKGLLDELRILTWWDDFLRVAGSMKLGWVTASLFVQKLQAFPQQNKLTQALQE